SVDFLISNNNRNLFLVQPAISALGVLSFTPATNAYGVATVTVSLRDNGGVANGGEDTSTPQTVSITVVHVNQPPKVTAVPPSANAQYSDPIQSVTVSAADVDSYGSNLTATVSWSTNGGVFVPGLPSGLTLAPTTTIANSRTWTLSGRPQLAP